jgi:RNA polymerase sigma-70 factor, ECF subfamily
MRPDIDLAISLLKQGDPEALEKALGLLQQSVFAFGMRVCGHRQDAEDTMQEVLLKALPYLPKFENSKALTTWLYKVAKNHCLMSRRRSKFAPKQELSLDELMPNQKELEQLDAFPGNGQEEAVIRAEQRQRLREVIQRVPSQYRIVLVLRDMEGFTDEEVGEITGLRSGTVRVRLHRARLFVRKELAKKNGRPGRGTSAAKGTQVSKSRRCRKIFGGLSDFLDGELDSFSCEEIEAHMNGCEPCMKFLRSLERSIEQCRKAPPEGPDPEKAAVMRKQLLAAFSRALAVGKN